MSTLGIIAGAIGICIIAVLAIGAVIWAEAATEDDHEW